MNKAELIDEVQRALGADCSKAHAERVVNSVLSSIGKGLREAGQVQLVGFGTFQVKARAARTGRNPRNNEVIQIPASKSIAFKAGAKLKEEATTPGA
ncbi:MAG: HU family DNA-binding protein [Planctomycetes bacterium]|nr:HU family DNA-binding protein [Planctomycetota bacterium]